MRKFSFVLIAALLLPAACKRGEQAAGADGAKAPSSQTATGSAPTEAPPQQAQAGTDVGSAMPEYTSSWLDGSKFELAARRDKVVLLNVWATWCGPCRYEIPELQALHDRYASRGFEVIGVSVDESGVDAVRKFVEEQKMTYPIVLDAEGKLASMLQTSVLPTSIIVDRTGKIVWKKFGLIQPGDQELKKAIETSL